MSRAYFPWPGAVTQLRCADGKIQNITICSAKISDIPAPAVGQCADIAGKLIVGCGDSTALEILELIPSGGKRMNAASFRNGLRGALPEFITELEI
jgi:methionyl-tRNA formyltransferase